VKLLVAASSLVILCLVFCVSHTFSQGSTVQLGLNQIEGRVTDENGNAVYNAYIELYSDLGSMINRQRTNGSGAFAFHGMGPGRYTIWAKPFGTNLQQESRDIEVNNQSSRSDTVFVDFRLHADKRFTNPTPELLGVVFAQDTPPDAKRLYISGVDEIKSDRTKGLADLQEAIRLFPKYFDALRALGTAHIIGGEYEKGYPYLLRALDVNVKCPDCYYSLGLAFYKLDQPAAGIKAADAAALLAPQSVSVQLLRGMLYLLDKQVTEAEKALTAADKLAKGANPEVHWQLALLYNRLKRNDDAVKELETYLKLSPDLSAKQKQNVRDIIDKMKKAH